MTATIPASSSSAAVQATIAPDTDEAAQHPAAAPRNDDAPPPPSTAVEELRQVKRLLWAVVVLLALVGMYFASTVMVPLAAALLLNFLFKPIIRRAEKLHIPPTVSAIAIVVLVLGALVVGGTALAGSLQSWMTDLPRSVEQLKQKAAHLRGPLQQVTDASAAIGQITEAASEPKEAGIQEPVKVEVQASALPSEFLTSTGATAGEIMIAFFIALFLMASGDLLLRQLIQWLPTLDDKKEAVEAWRDLESQVSAYLITVTAINAALGVVTALVMWGLGVPHAIWWGALAFIANYIPYIGPLVTTIAIFCGSVLAFDSLGQALLPPAVFVAITSIEGNFITPTIVGRRLSLNPLIVFVWLVFWGWMWGIPGALLAVPLLVCFKIVCDHVKSLEPLSNLLSGYVRKAGEGNGNGNGGGSSAPAGAKA